MKHTPTTEQQAIIESAKTGTNLAIRAFAGAAKTSTCVMVAEAVSKKSLYIAFNKSIADEASTKFPRYVECRTVHSLAYRAMITPQNKHKLQGFYEFKDVLLPYGLDKEMASEIRHNVINYTKLFCQSAYLTIEELIVKEKLKEDTDFYINLCNEYWDDITSPHSQAKMTHDVYLKMFQLSNPTLPYELLYLDEAQDSSPVVLSIVLAQKQSQLVIVGDQYQAIYEWRGAINALDNLGENFSHLYLTESFRFTPQVAEMATKLTSIIGNDRKVIGNADKSNYNGNGTSALIVRTNSTILNELLWAEANGEKVFVLADLKELWSKMYHISAIMSNTKVTYPNKELAQFANRKELEEAAEQMPELNRLIKLTMGLSDGGLTNNINRIKSVIVTDVTKAGYTLTTAHKSKGLEWDEVTLTEDMLVVREGQEIDDVLFESQTVELLYVAITRAKYYINIPELVQEVIDDCKLYKVLFNRRG
jgi:superfamily I DNA/RNA helicase